MSMLKRTPEVALVAAVLMCGAWAAAPHSAAPVQAAAANRIEILERAINQELARRGGVGATVAIVENGRPLLAKGFGRRSVDSPAPAGDETLFGIGSVTKQ